MSKTIAVFNPIGGAGRTTTALYLAWTWAASGHRVVLIDADSRRDLSRQLLDPDTVNRMSQQDPTDVGTELSYRRGLVLVRAPDDLVECESKNNHRAGARAPPLSIAIEELRRAQSFIAAACSHKADYVVIDLGPNLGALNRSLILASDGLLVPLLAHYLCRMALNSLTSKLSQWIDWRASVAPTLAAMGGEPAPPVVRLLGTTVRRCEPRGKFQLVAELARQLETDCIPALAARAALFPAAAYRAVGLTPENGFRSDIDDFRGLFAISRPWCRPILSLSDEQLGQAAATRIEFRRQFTWLADRSRVLLSYA